MRGTEIRQPARDTNHERHLRRCGHRHRRGTGPACTLYRSRRYRAARGADGKPYETRFELRLPTEWSGRFFYQGGGGNDGTVGPAVGRNTGSFSETALARGFAVVSTDAGHQGGGPEFGLDPSARIDHAYAAHERTATTAKAFIARYYGRGRQELLRWLFRRRPTGHDVRAALPRLLRRHRRLRAGDERVERRDDRRRLGHADLLAIAPADARAPDPEPGVLERRPRSGVHVACSRRAMRPTARPTAWCSAPMQCRFDPAALRCRGGRRPTTCLTRAGRRRSRAPSTDPVDSSGRRLYVGQPGIGDRRARVASVEARYLDDADAQCRQHDAHGRSAGV